MALIRISIESDNSGHNYIIPYDRRLEFAALLDNSQSEDFDLLEFDTKFGGCRLDGCISNAKLFANFENGGIAL